MRKQLIIAVIICTLFIFGSANSCPSYNGNDLLQSGKNAIMRGTIGGNPEYSYEAPINFMVPSWGMEIAVTTSTIGDYNPLPNYGYNYYIEASRKGTSNSIVYKLIMNNDQSWTSVQLSYLACARSDITVGNFEAPLNEWAPATSNVYNIYNKISRTLPKANYNVAAFISGFSTTDSQFALTINKKSYDNDKKNLTISFYCSADPAVLTLTITYVIYPDTHQILDISYNLTPQGDSGSYQISGPVNFQPNKRIQYNEWRVENRNLACTGNECTGICMLREQCAKANGNIWQEQCIFCSPGVIFEYGQCTRRCGANQIYLNRVCVCANGFSRQGKDCVNIVNKTCGTNQVYSETQKQCVCKQGCFDSGSLNCLQCPSGAVPSDDGKTCVCTANDQLWDQKNNICKNRCGSNQQWINNKCECVPTHCWYNQVCRQCPSNASPSADRTTCVCKSATAYFALQTNTCVECDAKSNWVLDHDKNKCICKTGYSNVNGTCVVSVQCKDNEVYNSKTNKCDCKSGLIRDGTICRPPCATNQVWDGKFCVCATGTARYGTCKKCPDGSQPNADKSACVCKSSSQIFSLSSFECINCPANSSPNAEKTSCVCNSGYTTDAKGVCIPVIPTCVDPEVLSSDKKSCECKDGYIRDSNKKCVFRCNVNQIWTGKACVCAAGYARYGGVCKLCPTGSQPNADQTKCVCSGNQIFASSSFTCLPCQANSSPNVDQSACICNNGYSSANGACIINCYDPEVLSSDKQRCQCKDGYIRDSSNRCVYRCGANQIWNGKSCVCNTGFVRNNGVCKSCPTGSQSSADQTKCICAGNQIFVPSSFTCAPCQANSSPNANQSACLCNSGYSFVNDVCIINCYDPEVLSQDKQRCQCKDGYIRDSKGKCQFACGSNQIWTGKACVCGTGYARYGGVCKLCPIGSQPNADQTKCVCSGNQIFIPSSFTCVSCQANSSPNQDQSACVCNNGYSSVNDACIINCYDPEVLSSDKQRCQCKDGYIRDSKGKCVFRCDTNEIWNGKSCVCNTGFVRNNGVCKLCPTGSQPNADQTKCVCSGNQIFSSSSFTCIPCQANSSPNADQSLCICNSGYSAVNSACIINCYDPEVLSQDKQSCECKDGFIRDATKKCVFRCNANEIWTGKACVCATGYARYGGVCKLCPAGSLTSSDQTKCICKDLNQIFSVASFACVSCQTNSAPNQDFSACVCNSGYTLTNGACLPTCTDPFVFNPVSGTCQCKSGYFAYGNGCLPNCPSGQQWNGTACVCPDGQALYGTCKTCPTGSLPNAARTACICTDSGSIFQTSSFSCYKCPKYSSPNANLTACVCNSGFTQTSNGCDLKCGANQIANYTLGICQCEFGYYTPNNSTNCVPRCGNNEQYNGVTCICKPGCGHWNKVCTICPANSVSNSDRTACKCLAPNFIFNPSSFKCEVCPPYSTNSEDGTQCVCIKGYQNLGGYCQPICEVNEEINKTTNQCDCIYGFMRLGPLCVERCGINNEWTGTECRCKQGYVKQNGVCKPCPSGASTNPSRSTCLCGSTNKIFDFPSFTCIALPPYSCANHDFSDFICLPGYNRANSTCVNSCPTGAVPDNVGLCGCTGGLYLDSASKTCKQPLSCPAGSTWNSNTLNCVCSATGQYVLNGQCKTCGANSFYSAAQQQCVCNTGFFNIGTQCTTCDPRTRYNGTDCVCQLGYYGTRDKCNKCHASCSVCSGPEANQCSACSDVSMILQNGYCTKNSPCDPGFFLDENNTKTCQKCTDNCIICDNIFECQQCAIGYQTQVFEISGQNISACVEICGDGIKYEAECDDGNTISGDGCSGTCNIEPGWTCVNGSSVQKSKCNKYIPDTTVITSMGIVNLGDRVVQSIRASYLPTCLTQNECSNCFKALTVKVVQANVPILCTVNFVPFSQWQFLLEYNFQGLYVTSAFKTVIKLNQAFRGCLSDDDFDQQLEVSIDPAFLAKIDTPDILTLDDINPSSSQINVPSNAKSILKIN